MPALHFLLVPDAGAARRVRRRIAGQGARSGVVVGAWPELLEWARRAYLVPVRDGDWPVRFKTTLASFDQAFWAESFKVAPDETAQAVEGALRRVLSATDPSGNLATEGLDSLPPRPRRHLADLLALAAALGPDLPDDLALLRELLAAPTGDALLTLRVEQVEGLPALTRWQQALVDKLNRDASQTTSDPTLTATLEATLADPSVPSSAHALATLQRQLYKPTPTQTPRDPSVQWAGVRDFLQEAEVAAGTVQALLREDPGLKPANIGLLVPDSFEYATALEDAFRLAGLALSGLPAERWRRDLGAEAVYHFLHCRQKPAPAMALAVCLSSPLMPWGREQGAVFAQDVMDGDYELSAPKNADAATRRMLELIRGEDDDPASLSAALAEFVALLDGGEALAEAVLRAHKAAQTIQALLAAAATLDWQALRRAVTPKFITTGETPDFNLEGVTVWRESQEPWRAVKRLIVLGFAQGHYPSALANDPVFSAEDVEAIRKTTNLPVERAADLLEARRSRFRRQLGAASETVTFLVPRRDPAGEAQAPSESLVFMHRLFDGPPSADALIAELDAADERAQVSPLALAPPAAPTPPRTLETKDLTFQRDLLALRTHADGALKPESPSSLETLMVSPLAWLLRRVEAEPLKWAPEKTTPPLLGSLAHAVFERLFQRGAPLPAKGDLAGRVEALVEEEVRRIAPFLRSAQWKVERRNFVAQTTKAAEAWRDLLEQLGAEVLAEEEWLQGTWGGIPVHGQTDLILGLPGERLLIVDYKRSKSRKRVEQMQKGYDSQASLYRAMLETGGPKNPKDPALARRLAAAKSIGIVYYMLNDQAPLTDTALPEAPRLAGWRHIGNDISREALTRIAQHVADARIGKLKLNRVGDEDFFDKRAGLNPYALDKSPLTSIFRRPAEEGAP